MIKSDVRNLLVQRWYTKGKLPKKYQNLAKKLKNKDNEESTAQGISL